MSVGSLDHKNLDRLALLFVRHADRGAFDHAWDSEMTFSSSFGKTLKPLTRIMSFLRSTILV